MPWFDDAATADAARLVHEPLLAELARRGIPFSGCLYAGLMLTADGPRVLEYNVRFGDPETQALAARFDGDLAAALAAIAHGAPDEVALGVGDDAAVTLVLAAPGYPEATRTGQPITGIERAEALPGVSVQHAGTALRDGRLVVASAAACSASRRRRRPCTSRASARWRARGRSHSTASTCAATSRCARPRRKHVSDDPQRDARHPTPTPAEMDELIPGLEADGPLVGHPDGLRVRPPRDGEGVRGARRARALVRDPRHLGAPQPQGGRGLRRERRRCAASA